MIPTLLKQRACELIADDYNKQCDEEDKVSPEFVRFALSGEFRFLDDQLIRTVPTYDLNVVP